MPQQALCIFQVPKLFVKVGTLDGQLAEWMSCVLQEVLEQLTVAMRDRCAIPTKCGMHHSHPQLFPAYFMLEHGEVNRKQCFPTVF